MIRAAIDGLGLTFSFEEYVAPQIASGALVRVLEDWCPPFAGYFLYYPSRRQQPAALSALIETLRLQDYRQPSRGRRRLAGVFAIDEPLPVSETPLGRRVVLTSPSLPPPQ